MIQVDTKDTKRFRGRRTRALFLTVTENLALKKGFGSATVDEILAETGMTKGAFYYHFKSKADLGHALVQWYSDHDLELFGSWLEEIREQEIEPRHAPIIFIQKFEDYLRGIPGVHEGCIFASFAYEKDLFDDDVLKIIQDGLSKWRKMYEELFKKALLDSRKGKNISAEELSFMIVSLIEGGIIMSRAFDNKKILIDNLRSFRSFLKSVF